MVSRLNNQLILAFGGIEAALSCIASPMTEGVFPQWARCLSFAMAFGLAAVLKLSVELSRVDDVAPLPDTVVPDAPVMGVKA